MPIDPYLARGVNPIDVGGTFNALAQQNYQRQDQQQRNALMGYQIQRQQRDDQASQNEAIAKRAYAGAQRVAAAPDPKAAAEQMFPEFVQHYDEQHGAGAWAQLGPDKVKQMADGLVNKYGMELGQGPPQDRFEKVGDNLVRIGAGGVSNAFSAPPKPQGPESTAGKLASDLKAGLISKPEYDAAMRKDTYIAPPAQTNVNIKQEGAESQTVGKGFGEQYIDIQKAGMASQGKIARFDRIGSLLEGISTGKLTPKIAELASVAQSLGINLDPKLGDKQGAEALSNEIALQLRNPSGGAGMPGAMSDKDREFLSSMTPGLGKTPQGNKLIIETAKKLAQRDQVVAKMAREYRQKNGQMDEGFFNQLDEYSASHPLFPQAPKTASAIPEGATATGPGGKRIQMRGGQWVPLGQ